MWSIKIVFLLCFNLVYSDKSFTIVVDTTRSMFDDIDVIKTNLPSVLNTANNDIGDYILVPFNEDVLQTSIVQTPRDLLTAINRLQVYGGQSCPENSLSGIERALQISKPESNIFVFTDAYAKDVHKLASIENLCKSTRSQVVIFLTNNCDSTPSVSAQAYYDVTKACSGIVFRLEIFNLRQAFKYIKEVIKVKWTEVTPYVISDYKEFSFSVDSFTKTVIVAVSGQYPVVVLLPGSNKNFTTEIIVQSRNSQVIRLVEVLPGEHTVAVRCESTTSVVVYKKNQIPLRIGFSPEQPRSIIETSHRPLPGRINYMFIEVTESTTLESIAVQAFNDQEKKVLELEEIPNTKFYLTKTFIDVDKSFRIWFNGYDKVTYQKVTGWTESLIPQSIVIDPTWTEPKVELVDEVSVRAEFGKNVRFACKVKGYPKPTVWWEDDKGDTVSTASDGLLLEIPSLYISYVQIENVTTNFTLYCKCKNSKGEDSQQLDVSVYRPFTFEVLQSPEDQTIEYDSEGKLYCKVAAYPEAETKWYHNYTEVTQSEDIEVLTDENALYIKRMTLDAVGEYKCEVSNEVEAKTFTAQVTITGIEEPQVEIENPNVVLKLGDWTTIECTIVKGKPEPELDWQYKSKDSYDFGALPETVVIEDGKLKIAAAQVEHNGVFKCNAENIKGQHSAEVTITVQQPPSIASGDTPTIVVKEDDDVKLPCVVTASPPAKVHWEMSQDDVIIPFDNRHQTDEDFTHRFKALGNDSGSYHCIAENGIGTAEKTITVNVLVKPFIEPPKSKMIRARAGDNITLMCNVIFGNPVPTTKWDFIALDSTIKTLKRGNSSSVLYLNDVRHTEEGSYMCVAVNTIGTDSITIDVRVR